ncbi:hypothetical protein T492DRAFT_441044 [Pavlovales sp. CCMP2436]|nr:hypothetical protein T492DRAFT_441044 [Pavlovales sp. CCMP2436]
MASRRGRERPAEPCPLSIRRRASSGTLTLDLTRTQAPRTTPALHFIGSALRRSLGRLRSGADTDAIERAQAMLRTCPRPVYSPAAPRATSADLGGGGGGGGSARPSFAGGGVGGGGSRDGGGGGLRMSAGERAGGVGTLGRGSGGGRVRTPVSAEAMEASLGTGIFPWSEHCAMLADAAEHSAQAADAILDSLLFERAQIVVAVIGNKADDALQGVLPPFGDVRWPAIRRFMGRELESLALWEEVVFYVVHLPTTARVGILELKLERVSLLTKEEAIAVANAAANDGGAVLAAVVGV